LGDNRFQSHNFTDKYSNVTRVADFDADGDLDLLQFEWDSQSIYMFANDGNGNFTESTIHVDGVAFVIDVDRNGQLDIIYSVQSGLRWHKNLGGLEFAKSEFLLEDSNGSDLLGVVDFDLDGDDDIVLTDKWIENRGTNDFQIRKLVRAVSPLLFEDFDNDGLLDLLGTNPDRELGIAKGISLGQFGLATFLARNKLPALSIAAGDLDNNGADDLVIGFNDRLELRMHDAAGQVISESEIELQGVSLLSFGNHTFVSIEDIDSDGQADIITNFYGTFDSEISGRLLIWHRNLGGGQFAGPAILHELHANVPSVDFADFDNDGDLDFTAGGDTRHGGCYCDAAWYENDGQSVFTMHSMPGDVDWEFPRNVIATDVDQDGRTDIVSENLIGRGRSGQVVWYRNDAINGFEEPVLVGLGRLLAVGEIDGRNGVDIILREQSRIANLGAPIDIATLSNDRRFEVRRLDLIVNEQARLARIEDVDSDGDLDFVSASEEGGLYWQQNDGNGRFTTVYTFTSSVMQDITFGDLDADGDLDLAAVVDEYYIKDRSSAIWFRNELISPATGDFNYDNTIDTDDIGLLCQAIWADDYDARFDLDADDSVDISDHEFLIENVMGANYGDANLDGRFDSSDLQQVFAAGRFESEEDATWETGDWNCDGKFTTSDLVVAFQKGVYQRG
jgi:hypothetical protein